MHAAERTASITIRNIDRSVKEKLRVRAAEHGHSMEAEARRILEAALASPGARMPHLFDRVRARFTGLDGDAIDPSPREAVREPPRFD
jgi:plasmid stability protein